jgi:hypothetical protein
MTAFIQAVDAVLSNYHQMARVGLIYFGMFAWIRFCQKAGHQFTGRK